MSKIERGNSIKFNKNECRDDDILSKKLYKQHVKFNEEENINENNENNPVFRMDTQNTETSYIGKN